MSPATELQPNVPESAPPLPRVLCIDDEPMVLHWLQRSLRRICGVETADGGEQGVSLLQSAGPYSVVISDMRMPGIDGATTLAECAKLAPHTSRILLTGHAEVEAAIRAVNDGHVLRFLTKPCAPDQLLAAVSHGIENHRLLTAEQDVLERTLNGAVNVLTDVLGLTSPLLFTRTSAVRRIVKVLADKLKIANAWKIETAAMLSRLGCIAVPSETLERHFSGQLLSKPDQLMLDAHPEVAYRLLSRIPRLEDVAEIVRRQTAPGDETASHEVVVGAEVLRLALALDRRLLLGESVLMALHQLQQAQPAHRPALLAVLRDYQPEAAEAVVHVVKLRQLLPEMVLDQDVKSSSGRVLVSKGTEVSFALIEKLRRFADGGGIEEPIRVRGRPA